jgi:predicted O-methyltransferase YrrM
MMRDKKGPIPDFARDIKGFLSEQEGERLFVLALEAARLGPCLEIGSFCGKSTVYIGTACKYVGVTLYTIDHHRGSEEQQPGQPYFDPEIYDSNTGRIDSLPLLRSAIHRANLEDTVVPMITLSNVASRNWSTPLSFIFIDGGHAYATVLSDYLCWHNHLVQNGYLVFHDIYPDPSQGGQAPYEIFKKARATGEYQELPMTGSLGILKKR